jgi:hypothetical protein
MARKSNRCAGCRRYGHTRSTCKSRPPLPNHGSTVPEDTTQDQPVQPTLLPFVSLTRLPEMPVTLNPTKPRDFTRSTPRPPVSLQLSRSGRLAIPIETPLTNPERASRTRDPSAPRRPVLTKKTTAPLMKRARLMSTIRWQHRRPTPLPRAVAPKATNPLSFEEALRAADQAAPLQRIPRPARR